MVRTRPVFAAMTVLALASVFSSYGIIGVGVHYGLDMTLNMEDKTGEAATFDSLKLTVSSDWGQAPSDFTKSLITGADIPIKIDRTDWKRHWFDIGGKVYIDIIPFIDVLEVSGNFGMWEYAGSIIYPTSISFKSTQPSNPNAPFIDRVDVGYDTTSLTLEDLDLDNPFMKNTPFAKLNLDLTIRKYIIQFPPALKTLKLYGGAGASLNFATPMLSAGMIESALGDTLNKAYSVDGLGQDVFGNVDVMQEVGREFLGRLFTPHWGAHIVAGAMIKIPIIPIGIYVDGKLMIPFGDMDENVDIGGFGFLLNAGIALSI